MTKMTVFAGLGAVALIVSIVFTLGGAVFYVILGETDGVIRAAQVAIWSFVIFLLLYLIDWWTA